MLKEVEFVKGFSLSPENFIYFCLEIAYSSAFVTQYLKFAN